MSPSTPERQATRRPRAWPGLKRRAPLHHVLVQPDAVLALDVKPGVGPVQGPGRKSTAVTASTLPLWLAAHPGVSVHVALSGRLVHPVLSRQEALVHAGAQDRLAWARQQFLHFHGSDAATWPLALWCQPPVVAAVALHGVDMAAWQAASAQHGCQILSVQPWWAHLPDVRSDVRPEVRPDASPVANPSGSHAKAWPGLGAAGLLAVEGASAGAPGAVHATWMGFEQGRLVSLEQRRAEGAGAAGEHGLVGLLQGWQQAHGVTAKDTRIMAFGLQAAGGLGNALGSGVGTDLASDLASDRDSDSGSDSGCRHGNDLTRALALHGQLLGDPASAVPPLHWVTV